MTKEKAIEVLLKVRPCVIDNAQEDALDLAIEALSKPSLPSNLDEAKYTFSERRFPEENGIVKMAAMMGYEAGAEWMAGQGETFKEVPVYISYGDEKEINLTIVIEGTSLEFLETGDKVIVQIRKKN